MADGVRHADIEAKMVALPGMALLLGPGSTVTEG